MTERPNVKSVGTLITRVHTVAGREAGAEDLIAKYPHVGERNHINVTVDGIKEPVSVAEQNRDHTGAPHHAGDTVYLSWIPEAMVILPRD